MAINCEHASEILKRVFDCQDRSEQIELISGKDKRSVHIHRVILNAASKYFADLLGPNFQDEKPKEFVLDDSEGATIKSFVNFCYTGNIDLTEENVEKCLKIAFSAEIDLLEDKCREYYSTNLSVANAVCTLMIADKYRLGDLRERAFHLICEKFDSLPSTDIQKLSQPLLQEVLKCDEMQHFGDLCAKRLLEWFQFDENERSCFMPETLKYIRLEQLTSEFLSETIEAVFNRFKCSDLVNMEYKRRAMFQCGTSSARRSQSIYSVMVQNKGDNNAAYSAVKVERYNDVMNCFEKVREIILGPRQFFGISLHKNKLYIMGGSVNNTFLKSVSSYDLNSGEEEVLPDMEFARSFITVASFGDHIFVFGGHGDHGELDLCERFDVENKLWANMNSMNEARHLSSATVCSGYIYITGGLITGSSVELYDPEYDEWRQTPPMKKRRSNFALTELNGFLYAMGCNKTVEKFDPYKNCWKEIGSFHNSERITGAIKSGDRLFAIMSNGIFGQVEVHDNGTCSFIPLCESKYEPARRFLFSV